MHVESRLQSVKGVKMTDKDQIQPRGKAKGGAARSASLTPERRKEISQLAVQAKRRLASLPKSAYMGILRIGDEALACCVLEDGRRIISEHGMSNTFGSSGGKTYRLRDAGAEKGSGPMPLFVASKALKPFVDATFEASDLVAIEFVANGKILRGYDASILPKVCEVWLAARDTKGALQESQLAKAKKAEILMRGLARVGIVALIDEATGYQKDRARDELAKILEAFVAKELQPWVKTFPANFYEQMFRLRGLPFDPAIVTKPAYFGHLTNNVIYRRLAPGVLSEIKTKKKETGTTTNKLHQFLTKEIGHPKLKDLVTSVTTVMMLSDTWDDFMPKLDRVHPAFDDTLPLPLELNQDTGQGL